MSVSFVANQFKSVGNIIKQQRKEGLCIAKRVSQIKKLNKPETKIVEFKAVVRNVVKPFFDWASSKSDTVNVIKNTANKVKRNINKHVGRAVTANPNASKIIAGVKGVDASLPVLGSAALVVTGVQDIKDAKKDKGTMAGVKEAGKSFVRVVASAACATAGALLVPVPGMATAGWLAGETIAKLTVGKSYSAKNKLPQNNNNNINK